MTSIPSRSPRSPANSTPATDNAQNVILTPAEGDFTVTTKLDFIPNGDYQTAGIIVYQDTDNIYGAYKRYHSGFGGNIFTDFVMNNGSFSEHTHPWMPIRMPPSISRL